MKQLVASLGDQRVRVRAYSWTRARAQQALEAPTGTGDRRRIALVTFRGRLAYRKARTIERDKTVTGRFAFAIYDLASGEPLDFGVFPQPPAGLAR